jgi:hypothetical protein
MGSYATMRQRWKRPHESAEWKELARRNIFEDVFRGTAQFTKYPAVRMEEYKAFYDATGLAKQNP